MHSDCDFLSPIDSAGAQLHKCIIRNIEKWEPLRPPEYKNFGSSRVSEMWHPYLRVQNTSVRGQAARNGNHTCAEALQKECWTARSFFISSCSREEVETDSQQAQCRSCWGALGKHACSGPLEAELALRRPTQPASEEQPN